MVREPMSMEQNPTILLKKRSLRGPIWGGLGVFKHTNQYMGPNISGGVNLLKSGW